jgi:hypothetical protein
MSLQLSVAARDAQNDAIETTVSTAPKLYLLSGAVEANCAAADTGTICAILDLPSDWLGASSAGVKSKAGTWSGVGHANASTGTDVGHFRIKDTAGTTVHLQGTVTVTAGGGDMTMDNISVATDQAVTVNSFALTAGNA